MKKIGQNFLIDENIARKIAELAEISENDIILEIGPGKGTLTKYLCEKASKVIGIEIDRKLAEELKMLNLKNLQIINADALKIEFPRFNKIVSNLPYQISSPITEKFFKYDWDIAVLMYQKEFAKRMIAKPGTKEWSRISVLTQYYSDIEIAMNVSKNKFKPVPKVDSAVVILKKKEPEFEADENFWKITKLLFQHKKKLVKNSLIDSKINENIIEKIPVDMLNKRVFQCSLSDFKEIADSVKYIL